jgi:hypothetical protein
MKRKDPFKINRVLDIVRSHIHRAAGISRCLGGSERDTVHWLRFESDIHPLTKLKTQVVWPFKKGNAPNS